MKQYLGPLLASTVVATAAIPAWGMEELLVTGSYSAQQELTSSVAVLDAERIGVLNKRTLSGLLKTVPGLLVEEQGGPGGLTAVSVRGGEANFTLVLLDGVPVNDPTNTRGGGFDFANLNSALVERVEVVRGAASAVYGSDALAGVINIVTRRPATGYRESLSVELGEDDYQQFSVSALGREGVFDYTVEIATRDDGDPVPGSARDSDSANLRLGWQPDERHDLTFNFRYLEGDRTSYPEQSGGPEFAAIDALDEAHYEDQLLGITWDMQVSPGWRSRLSLTRFDHEEDYTSPGIVPFDAVPPNAGRTDFTRDQLQWVNSVEPAPGYRLDVGADYREE
ncbi:MAG: TonB-dependent receptor plug domain-containing protein, partial [Halioglobus sp.]|nr:TonB-dependent receptor plug domain-containing protein [Halioglobus sp.]